MLKDKRNFFKGILYVLACGVGAYIADVIGKKNLSTVYSWLLISIIIIALELIGIFCFWKRKV